MSCNPMKVEKFVNPGHKLLCLYYSGILIVYMIMIGDVLVGTEKSGYNGVLPSIAEDHTGTKWYLTRWFVVSKVLKWRLCFIDCKLHAFSEAVLTVVQ